MEELGTLKVYVAVNSVHKRLGEIQRPVQIYSSWCTKSDAKFELQKLVKMNRNLPICRVTWTLIEDLQWTEVESVKIK